MDRVHERKLVLDLLKQGDNAKTIKRIVDNYPDLGHPEYTDRWKNVVSQVSSVPRQDFDFVKHPKGGEKAEELKITVPRWVDRGIPFTLMLRKRQKTAVRVLVAKDDYERSRNTLGELAKSNDDLLGDFPVVKGWVSWRAVLKSDSNLEYPEETLLHEADVFEEAFWEQVEEILRTQLIDTELLNRINQWLASPPT